MLGAGVETREDRPGHTLLVTTGPPWKVLDEDAYIDRESLRPASGGLGGGRLPFQFSRAKMRYLPWHILEHMENLSPLPPFSCSMLCFALEYSEDIRPCLRVPFSRRGVGVS